MNDNDLLIRINADPSGFIAQIDRLKKEAKALEARVKKLKIGGNNAENIAQAKRIAAEQQKMANAVFQTRMRLFNQEKARKLKFVAKLKQDEEQSTRAVFQHVCAYLNNKIVLKRRL